MKDLLTPKQVARAIGVSESSLKRWCDRGLIPTVRTPGGHRRLPISGVLQFLRTSEHRVVVPEVLGLPATSGTGERGLERARGQLVDALVAGDTAVCRQIILDLYLADHPLAAICDRVIAAAFEEIGERWECGEVAVYEERRACEITIRILHELEASLPPVSHTAPRAVGGTPEGDHYWIPTTMVGLILRNLGWQATSLGSGLPVATLIAATRKSRPRLYWLSISHLADAESFLSGFADLESACERQDTAVVVGGRALEPAVRGRMRYSAYCDTMQHLEAFAKTLWRPPAESAATDSSGEPS